MRASRYLVLVLLLFLAAGVVNFVSGASINKFNATSINSSIQIPKTPQIEFLYAPIYLTIQPGQIITSQFSFKNTGLYTEYINLSTDNSTNILLLDTKSVLLPAGQNTSVTLLFRPTINAKSGTYYIPINVNVSAGNLSEKQIYFVTVNIQNRLAGKPYISSQIVLTNNTNIASGTIQISTPVNESVDNFTFNTTIITPQSLSINTSQIVVYGLNNNLTIKNNSYVIMWHVDHIPADTSVYAYYTIVKPASEPLLSQINEIFSPPVYGTLQSGNLKVTSIKIPTFYANTIQRLSINVTYTGTSAQLVNFSLKTLSGGVIYNGTKSVIASPNQTLNESFDILVGRNIGVLVLNLSVMTKGANITYTLPNVVVPQTPFKSINVFVLISIVLAIIVILLITYIILNISKSRNDPPRITILNPKIVIKKSGKKGKGMYAKELIKRGETVLTWGGVYTNKENANKAKREGRLVFQLDDNLYSVEDREEDIGYYINHSCDSNTWMKNAFTLVAKKDIKIGEEVTVDYALFESDESYTSKWTCKCKSSFCRKKITGKDWQLSEVQKRYKSHFSPLINKRIDAM